MLFCGFVQQLIVASSVFFLANAAASLTSGDAERAVRLFSFFLLTMALPYLPGVAAQYCWHLWKATLVRDFHRFAIDHISGGPKSYACNEASDRTTSIFSNGVPSGLEQLADYAYDFSQCVFNSMCGSLAIAAFVDARLGIAYFFTLAICALYIYRYYSISAAASETAERERVELATISRRIWPNLILRNSLSVRTWTNRLMRQHEHRVQAVQREAGIRNISNLVLSLASVVPVAFISILLIYVNMNDHDYLASLFVTMPRMFSILALASLLLAMVFEFSSVYGQLRIVEELFGDVPEVGSVKLSSILVEADGDLISVSDLDEFFELCQNSTRIKIRGENGVGKTSMLLTVKDALQDGAFYLPAASALDLPGKTGGGSTGQAKKDEIQAALRDLPPSLLLLDEWDANLDAENRRDINTLIGDAITKGFTVVEISHR